MTQETVTQETLTKVEVFTTDYCPHCTRAKQLLKQKNVAFQETDLTHDPDGRERLVQRSGGRKTVPQIFIGDTHVGGCDDLYALESEGKLDPLLQGAAPR